MEDRAPRGDLLPPMVGIQKRIRGARGETRFAILPLWPFRVERRTGRVALAYSPPLSLLVDECDPRRAAPGSDGRLSAASSSDGSG
jgi:hypothetical protein